MWTQMGQLFWGARFPGHHQAQMDNMQSTSSEPRCFPPFSKMEDPTAHLGHPIMNKPGPSIPGVTGMMTPKTESHSNGSHSGGGGGGGGNAMSPSGGGGSSSSNRHNSNNALQQSALALNKDPAKLKHDDYLPNQDANNLPNPFLHNIPPPHGGPPSPASMHHSPPASHHHHHHQSPPKPNPERLKKCKAVFGQNQKELWCNKCRWKKKCVRFPESDLEPGQKADSPRPKKPKIKKKLPDPPTQVPPQHYRYPNPADIAPMQQMQQQQQAWYNSVVHTITGGTGLPPELLQQQHQHQQRYRNPNQHSSSDGTQYNPYSSSTLQNAHLGHAGVPPQFLAGQMPPNFPGLDPSKLKSNDLKSHFNKETMPSHHGNGSKSPSRGAHFGSIFSPDGGGLPGGGNQAIKNSNTTTRKCRALYGFEQKDKWCKPCRNKKRCIHFV